MVDEKSLDEIVSYILKMETDRNKLASECNCLANERNNYLKELKSSLKALYACAAVVPLLLKSTIKEHLTLEEIQQAELAVLKMNEV